MLRTDKLRILWTGLKRELANKHISQHLAAARDHLVPEPGQQGGLEHSSEGRGPEMEVLRTAEHRHVNEVYNDSEAENEKETDEGDIELI